MKLDDKRSIRELKRRLKRAGHKRVRAQVRQRLHGNPDDAHVCDEGYGSLSTARMHVDGVPDDT